MKSSARASAQARLRDRPGRSTEARVRVLAALLRAGRALSHQELESRLAPIDRVTLYRVLDWMAAEGLVHRIAGAGRAWRFAAADAAHTGHAHFQCSGCGSTVCLSEVRVPMRSALAVPQGYQPQAVELTVTGTCPGCAA